MKIFNRGITQPLGFKANGLWCGIKKSGKPDLSLIYSEVPAVAAAVFTKNSVKAAPLIVSQKHIRDNKLQAIIVNSGNANCFTGEFGLLYAERTTEVIGDLLNIAKENVLVASTGIIGQPLPFKKIERAAPKLIAGLTASQGAGQKAARGIMTTDRVPKEMAVEFSLGGKKVSIGACAKGAGMVAPDMATMLCFVTTDAAVSVQMLKKALKEAVRQSFNKISIDGCMSTNDMAAVMANGLAGNKKITRDDKNFRTFSEGLTVVCRGMAKKMILDAEGATKFVTIEIVGAQNEPQAQKAGLAVANSALVKTAAFGSNANWGRVAAAVGSLGIRNLTERNLRIKFSSFKKKEITITVDLNLGKAKTAVYTSDLSHEYVRINAEYN